MGYHKQETKHKKVCDVWGKTGQTDFTQLAHKTGKLKNNSFNIKASITN
jgi:hypothetical protein